MWHSSQGLSLGERASPKTAGLVDGAAMGDAQGKQTSSDWLSHDDFDKVARLISRFVLREEMRVSQGTWAVQWWEGANQYGIEYCSSDIEAERRAAEIREERPSVTTMQVIWVKSRWDAPKVGKVVRGEVAEG